jgi:hypothetical protein
MRKFRIRDFSSFAFGSVVNAIYVWNMEVTLLPVFSSTCLLSLAFAFVAEPYTDQLNIVDRNANILA